MIKGSRNIVYLQSNKQSFSVVLEPRFDCSYYHGSDTWTLCNGAGRGVESETNEETEREEKRKVEEKEKGKSWPEGIKHVACNESNETLLPTHSCS